MLNQTLKHAEAYGIIVVQGMGKVGRRDIVTPSMSSFVTGGAARSGVRVLNTSDSGPLVILKHFGPNHPDAESLRKKK